LGKNRLEQGQSRGGIVAKEVLGVDHGFASLDEGGKMNYGVKGLVPVRGINEKFFNQRPVGQVAQDELDSGRDLVTLCMAQIIKYNGLVTLRGQQGSHGTSDIPGTASNQDLHKNTVLPRTLWFTVSLLQQAGSKRPRETAHRPPKRRHPLACPVFPACV
jgi:hypothetical protein